MMEFEVLQKIWDTQNNQPLYVINEKELHNRIVSKKNQASHITNFSELLILFVFAGVGSFVIIWNQLSQRREIFMYVMGAWMIGTALILLISRIRRIRRQHRFDRSMLGDLHHAITTATYQVRLSWLMRLNGIVIGIILISGVWEAGKSIWFALGTLIFLIVTWFASGWEHAIYKAKKRELESLLNKLQQEGTNGDYTSV